MIWYIPSLTSPLVKRAKTCPWLRSSKNVDPSDIVTAKILVVLIIFRSSMQLKNVWWNTEKYLKNQSLNIKCTFFNSIVWLPDDDWDKDLPKNGHDEEVVGHDQDQGCPMLEIVFQDDQICPRGDQVHQTCPIFIHFQFNSDFQLWNWNLQRINIGLPDVILHHLILDGLHS